VRRGAVIACCAPPVLIAVDFAVLSVAVPRMGGDLGMARGDLRWLFSGYSLAFGCLLLTAGRAADTFGRRRLLVTGLVVFAGGALLTALARSGVVAIGGRAVQGAGAATMTPAALSLMTATTEEGDDRSRVLAAYGLAISTGFVIGTLTTGAIATVASWRPAVGTSSGLAIIAAVSAWRLLPRDRPADHDPTPTPMLTVALLVAVAALAAAEASPVGLAVAAAAAGALIVMAARLARAAAGDARHMAVACTAGLVVTGTGAAATLLLTLNLQNAHGYSPLGAGLVLACFGGAAIPGARVARRMSAGAAVGTGLAVQGAGLLLAVAAGDSGPAIVASVAGFGFGHVIGNASVAEVATAGVAAARHGALVGMLITAQYLGGALGPALLGRSSFQVGMATAGGLALATAAVAWRGNAAA
jgi:Major Facilitator Superfamily